MKPLIFLLLIFSLKSFGQTVADTAVIADYSANTRQLSFVNLSMRLGYSETLAPIIKNAYDSSLPVAIEYSLTTGQLISCKVIAASNKKQPKVAKELGLSSTASTPLSGVAIKKLNTGNNAMPTDAKKTKQEGAEPLLKPSMSHAEIVEIFSFLAKLSCDKSQNCYNDRLPCITFQYKQNGCQARAHLMRYYIENTYHLQSYKIFAFGNLNTNNAGGCGRNCISWDWHVAPLVYESDATGKLTQMVIDPSLFSEPVTVDQWKAIQVTCSNDSYIAEADIVNSSVYSWNYARSGWFRRVRYYYEDPDNTYTFDFLTSRCNTCRK